MQEVADKYECHVLANVLMDNHVYILDTPQLTGRCIYDATARTALGKTEELPKGQPGKDNGMCLYIRKNVL